MAAPSGLLPHCVSILENLVIPLSCKLDLITYEFSSLRGEFYSFVKIIERKFDAAEDATFGNTLRLSISPRASITDAFNNKDSCANLCSSFVISFINGLANGMR